MYMGGLKKQKVATPVSGAEKSKDVKIITRHVVTLSEVEKNPRLVTLLYIVSLAKNGISEKGPPKPSVLNERKRV
jgi:hypothetical protein